MLAAQIGTDFVISSFFLLLTRSVSLREQLHESLHRLRDRRRARPRRLPRRARDRRVALLPAPARPRSSAILAVFAGERRTRLDAADRAQRRLSRHRAGARRGRRRGRRLHGRAHAATSSRSSVAVAERLGLDERARRNVEFGALLHDVGKVAIPKEIINKPGPLDDAEWEIMRTHTIEGQRMLDRVGGFMREVGLIVRGSHERFDGGGYPDGLAGEAIPFEARIISGLRRVQRDDHHAAVPRGERPRHGGRRAGPLRRHAVRPEGGRGAARRGRPASRDPTRSRSRRKIPKWPGSSGAQR